MALVCLPRRCDTPAPPAVRSSSPCYALQPPVLSDRPQTSSACTTPSSSSVATRSLRCASSRGCGTSWAATCQSVPCSLRSRPSPLSPRTSRRASRQADVPREATRAKRLLGGAALLLAGARQVARSPQRADAPPRSRLAAASGSHRRAHPRAFAPPLLRCVPLHWTRIHRRHAPSRSLLQLYHFV